MTIHTCFWAIIGASSITRLLSWIRCFFFHFDCIVFMYKFGFNEAVSCRLCMHILNFSAAYTIYMAPATLDNTQTNTQAAGHVITSSKEHHLLLQNSRVLGGQYRAANASSGAWHSVTPICGGGRQDRCAHCAGAWLPPHRHCGTLRLWARCRRGHGWGSAARGCGVQGGVVCDIQGVVHTMPSWACAPVPQGELDVCFLSLILLLSYF